MRTRDILGWVGVEGWGEVVCCAENERGWRQVGRREAGRWFGREEIGGAQGGGK